MSRSPSRPSKPSRMGSGCGRGPHDVGAAVLVRGRHAEPHVGLQRLGHRRAAARPASGRWPGGPAPRRDGRRCWCGTPGAGRAPTTPRSSASAPVIRSQSNRSSSVSRVRIAGTPGAVAEGVGHGGPGLAARRELGPHLGHRLVEGQAPLVDQLQRQQGQDGLADRVHVDDRVVAPGPGAPRRPTRPPGRHHPAGHDDVHGRADLAALGEVRLERVADRLEPGGAPAVDRHGRAGPSRDLQSSRSGCWRTICS